MNQFNQKKLWKNIMPRFLKVKFFRKLRKFFLPVINNDFEKTGFFSKKFFWVIFSTENKSASKINKILANRCLPFVPNSTSKIYGAAISNWVQLITFGLDAT